MLGAPVRERAHVLQASCEPVALALELREAQQSRPVESFIGADARGVDGDVRKRRCDRLRDLALELGDLLAQRATSGALVEGLDDRCAAVDRQLLGVAHASTPPQNAGRENSTSADARELQLIGAREAADRAPATCSDGRQPASSEARAPHKASSA
jgi:hypothetical protein